MKKIWLLSVFPTVILLASCSIVDKGLVKDMFKKPKVSVEYTEFKGLDLEKVSLMVHMKIRNENPFSVTLRGIDYGLYVDRNEMPLFSSNVRETINIEAEQDNPVSFPVDLYYREIRNLDFSKTDILLGLKGHALLQTIVGNVKIPFDLEKSVPVPRLPEISIIDIKLNTLNVLQKTATLQLTLGVHNKNSFPLPINRFSFNLDLEGVKVSRNNRPDNMIIKPQGTEPLSLFIDLDLAKLKAVMESVLQGKSVKFKLDGSYGLDSPKGPEGLFSFSDISKNILEL